jgi:hypothetical protein
MPISTASHFLDLSLMPQIKSPEFPFPPQSFRMISIAFFPFSKNSPQGVKFSVLTQEVVSAQDI